MTLTPEEQERQKKLEEEIEEHKASLDEGWKRINRQWEEWVKSMKEIIATIDGIDPETASPELKRMLEKLDSTLKAISDLRTKPKE